MAIRKMITYDCGGIVIRIRMITYEVYYGGIIVEKKVALITLIRRTETLSTRQIQIMIESRHQKVNEVDQMKTLTTKVSPRGIR